MTKLFKILFVIALTLDLPAAKKRIRLTTWLGGKRHKRQNNALNLSVCNRVGDILNGASYVKSYCLITTPQNFAMAQATCAANGMTLVQVDQPATQTALSTVSQATTPTGAVGFWINGQAAADACPSLSRPATGGMFTVTTADCTATQSFFCEYMRGNSSTVLIPVPLPIPFPIPIGAAAIAPIAAVAAVGALTGVNAALAAQNAQTAMTGSPASAAQAAMALCRRAIAKIRAKSNFFFDMYMSAQNFLADSFMGLLSAFEFFLMLVGFDWIFILVPVLS